MRYAILIFPIFFFSCSTTRQVDEGKSREIYEVLTQQSQGGADIRFFEILSDEKEINMLMNDESLHGKIRRSDINTSNFVILNMGEKNTGGYSIGVDKVIEQDDKIILKVKETSPAPGDPVTMAFTYPYAVVKINSKKPIVIE